MLNFSEVIAANNKSSLYALTGMQRALLLQALKGAHYAALWRYESGLRLTQEDSEISENIASEANLNLMSPIVGMIISSPSLLDGFLLCDGSSYLESDYPILASMLGATGGSFNVPDLRGLFVRGASVSNPLYSTGGSSSLSIAIENLPSHSHDNLPHSHSEGGAILAPIEAFAGVGGVGGIPTPLVTSPSSIEILATGGNEPLESLPPYYSLLYLISKG